MIYLYMYGMYICLHKEGALHGDTSRFTFNNDMFKLSRTYEILK